MHVRNLPEVAEVFVNVFLLRFFVDARREDDPPFDGFLRFAVPFVGRSQTVVSVVPGVLDLGVDDVGVLEATALVEEKTRARARVYIYVSVQSLSTSKREKERDKNASQIGRPSCCALLKVSSVFFFFFFFFSREYYYD